MEDRIRDGLKRFQTEIFPQRRRQFEQLAASQSPRALFLTCGDSRIHPELLTGSEPGEIFVERNPGNMVPIYNDGSRVGVSTSIEYAMVELEVPRIIICGHSDCGAIKAILHPEKLGRIPAVSRWLSLGRDALALLDDGFKQTSDAERITRLTKLNVLSQMKHLETHPSVIERLRCNDLTIQGWVYEIHTGRVEAFNPQTGEFEIWPD